MAAATGAVMVPLADLLAWQPCVRRKCDPRQGELFDAGGDLPQPATTMPEWIARGISTEPAELDARCTWGLRRRLRWALTRMRRW